MSAVPPIAPESHQAGTASRVHRMRVARGACWVIVAVLFAGAVLALADAATPLPAWARVFGLAVWLTGFGVLVWRLVARRLPMDSAATAHHARTELGGNIRAAAAAALALAASLSAATLLPGAAEHIRRVALPWTRTAGPVLYRVKVTAGDPVVRRGDPVTLSAYAEKIDPSAATPDSATLFLRDRNGAETAIAMTGDGTGAFHTTRPEVVRGFNYRVEVGAASSDWHSVFVVDPVEPTAASRIEVVPPEYVPAGTPAVQRWEPFGGHENSTAKFHFYFSQPAATAFLEWRGDDDAAPALLPLVFDAERRSATASLRLRRDGTLKLVTVSEAMGKSLRSEFPVRAHVIEDAPPRFERLSGLSPRPRSARPDTRIRIAFTAVDDLAIGSAVLEYAAGAEGAKIETVAIPFSGPSPRRVEGRIDFDLNGKARVGDTIRLRLRVNDTRRLDQPELRPQSAVYPAAGWSVVRMDAAAPPLDEQDVLAQRNALNEALVAALEAIKSAQTEVAKIRGETAGRAELPLELTVRLASIRDGLRRVAAALRTAADECALTPELHRFAGEVAAMGDGHLRTVEDVLRRAATNLAPERAAALNSASDSLRQALAQIDRGLAMNHRIARARLDHTALAALVTDQAAVANLAQPGGAIQPEELARLERELHARLRKLIADSDALRGASTAAKESELRRLALALREQAGFLRDLDAAAKSIEAEARKSLLGNVAQTQRRFIADAAAVFTRAESAARLARADLPTAKELAHLTDLIESGRTVEALTELEARAAALEGIAAAMEKWAGDHGDTKMAARQLAEWQEQLRTRFRAATKDNPANFKTLPDSTKEAFRVEEIALQVVASALSIPSTTELRTLRRELGLSLSVAAGLGEPARAEMAMTQAIELLNRLADAIPTVSERSAKARTDFIPLLAAQEAILHEVEQSARGADAARQLPALVERQKRQVESFNALDIPGADGRKILVTAAIQAAVKDLRDGVASDALASQYWVKREFDRLRLVLDGQPALDEKAEELARKLAALVRSMDELGPSITEKQLQASSAEALALARQLGSFGVPAEAPALANAARTAALQLETAARDAVQKAVEYQKRLRSAAEAAAQLSARLTAAESDLDRVRRLAANRWADWDSARKFQGKPLNPDLSAEARRELVRESEELVFTRVGVAGQALKKAILEQYSRLKDHDTPDRQGGPLKQLAHSLDELAALMADIEDLNAAVDRTPPRRLPISVERYLPSRTLAESFRKLAGEMRSQRRRIARVNEEALALVRPSKSNPIAALEREQRDLAAAITALARQLEQENDSAAGLVLDAAIQATLAADGLAVGMLVPASGSAERALQALRQAAKQGRRPWVKSANDLAARQAAVRTRMAARPAPAEIAAQQLARGEDLGRRGRALANQLELAAKVLDVAEVAAAAKEAEAAATVIADSARKGADGRTADASRLRIEAADRLTASAEKVAALVPAKPAELDFDAAAIKAADALGKADAAMREALDALEPSGDRSAAEKAMRRAAEAISAAAEARAELFGQ
jgi:hypothetical protein